MDKIKQFLLNMKTKEFWKEFFRYFLKDYSK